MLNSFSIVSPLAPALILPSIFVFIAVLLFIPKASKSPHTKTKRLNTIVGYIAYHLMMVVLWAITWPQYTSSYHTGINLDGALLIAVCMFFWTGTGFAAIFAWHFFQNSNVKVPHWLYFVRLYIWNVVFFWLSRQIIYILVNRGIL